MSRQTPTIEDCWQVFADSALRDVSAKERALYRALFFCGADGVVAMIAQSMQIDTPEHCALLVQRIKAELRTARIAMSKKHTIN